jgi:HEPN domain-containing protein
MLCPTDTKGLLGDSKLSKVVRRDIYWWLQSAKDDYGSAVHLYRAGFHANALNLLHTATEKALKAAILSTGKRYPIGVEGHKLSVLYAMIKPRLRLSRELEDIILQLTPLYLPTKYPNAAFGIPSRIYGKNFSSRYVTKVGKILRWIERGIESRG